VTTTTQAESTIPTGTWQSDPIHSSVGFAVKHVVGTFRGTFNEFAATLSHASGSPQLSGRTKVESVHVSDENLYGHLLSPEFFDGEQHPEIIFESKEISRDGDKVTVEGELTVKGVTKPVVARGEIAGPAPGPDENDRLGIDLETIVDRHDFGLDWQMDLPGGGKTLGDDVTLTVHVELVKEMRGSSAGEAEEEPVS
jgi:polyisoprenoid-binding protein YceI